LSLQKTGASLDEEGRLAEEDVLGSTSK